jgi:hypothetical protein
VATIEEEVEALATVVVNAGRDIITNRLNSAGTIPLNIGWGTGVQTTALVTDTTLGPTTVEKLVDLTTSAGTDHTTGVVTRQTTTVSNDTFQVVGTRTATGSGAVTVSGLFDAASGGNLFAKGDFAAINLVSGDSIQFTWKVVFA